MATPPSPRLLLCPVCSFPNRFAADALETHLAMRHYPECLPYPCITGCRGTMRFPTEVALRHHSREEHRLTSYEVSFQPRNDDEYFQLCRIRAHMRHALAESNPYASDDEGDVKLPGTEGVTTAAAAATITATSTAIGGMNGQGESTAATPSGGVSNKAIAPQPLGGCGSAAVATPTVPNSSREASPASASAVGSGRPRGKGAGMVLAIPSGVASNTVRTLSSSTQHAPSPPIRGPLARQQQRLPSTASSVAADRQSARCTCGVLLSCLFREDIRARQMEHVNTHLRIPLFECRICSASFVRCSINRHLRSCHPHLRGAPVDELKRHFISHRSEENTERLRRAVERYFPTPTALEEE